MEEGSSSALEFVLHGVNVEDQNAEDQSDELQTCVPVVPDQSILPSSKSMNMLSESTSTSSMTKLLAGLSTDELAPVRNSLASMLRNGAEQQDLQDGTQEVPSFRTKDVIDMRHQPQSIPKMERIVASGSSSRRKSSPQAIQSKNKDVTSSSSNTTTAKQNIFNQMLEFLRGELISADMDDSYDVKKERVQNFLSVPLELEKLMMLGYFICLDSFLYLFTILPLRIFHSLLDYLRSIFGRPVVLKPAQKCDILKGCLIIACWFMLDHIDASRLYHSVRGQATIKLYVIFNVLEICDKLCSAFGHDILDSLFSKTTVEYTRSHSSASTRRLGRVTHFAVALLYVFAHSMVLFYQVMTLNVAINSYNNSLLTLLLSNQFVEIKGSVFKRFERENLFQLSCSDIVERFQLSIFLGIIMVRNMVELLGSESFESVLSFFFKTLESLMLPLSMITSLFESRSWMFPVRSWVSVLLDVVRYAETMTSVITRILASVPIDFLSSVLLPVLAVYITEILVDWLKHAFITKFNQIRPNVYSHYADSLCRDLLEGEKQTSSQSNEFPGQKMLIDRSPSIARRIGFVSIPLACLILRIAFQMVSIVATKESAFGLAPWDMDWNLPHAELLLYSNSSLLQIATEILSIARRPEIQLWILTKSIVVLKWTIVIVAVYVCLLVLKLAMSVFLVRVAKARLLDIPPTTPRHTESLISAPPNTKDSSLQQPTQAEYITKPRDLGFLDKTATGNLEWRRHGVVPEGGQILDPARPDEKLDKVDRFLMVKSRIV